MKTHSPSRTYNQGDKCYVYHTVDSITQRYTFESLGVQRSAFYPAMWRNVTPRVWRLSDLDIDGFVYEGDTVFIETNGFKNSTTGIKPVREFLKLTENIFGSTRIYAEAQTEYTLELEGFYVEDFFLRNSRPNWGSFSKTETQNIICSYIADKVLIKVVNKGETYDLYGNRLVPQIKIDRSQYGFELITTPLSGNESSQFVYYALPSVLNDYYYFILSTSANILSVERLALNTNP